MPTIHYATEDATIGHYVLATGCGRNADMTRTSRSASDVTCKNCLRSRHMANDLADRADAAAQHAAANAGIYPGVAVLNHREESDAYRQYGTVADVYASRATGAITVVVDYDNGKRFSFGDLDNFLSAHLPTIREEIPTANAAQIIADQYAIHTARPGSLATPLGGFWHYGLTHVLLEVAAAHRISIAGLFSYIANGGETVESAIAHTIADRDEIERIDRIERMTGEQITARILADQDAIRERNAATLDRVGRPIPRIAEDADLVVKPFRTSSKVKSTSATRRFRKGA